VKQLLLVILPFVAHAALAQASARFHVDTLPSGAWARMEIDNGDTVFVMSLRPVRIADRRDFKSRDEQATYFRYKRAAYKVYPYAVEAVNLYNEILQETADMKKGKRKRYIKKEHKELKEDFQEQMKKLTKTEGRVLIKMIELNLDKPFYDVITETRGGFTASYWHNLGKMWGYDLKQGYHPGDDQLLDEVFLDYDFTNSAWRY
jgi:hypothetical protein